jgi:hypothetical protein
MRGECGREGGDEEAKCEGPFAVVVATVAMVTCRGEPPTEGASTGHVTSLQNKPNTLTRAATSKANTTTASERH